MKRVLHISKYYYPFTGGIEQVVRDSVNSLKGYCEQKIICFNEDAKADKYQTRRRETVYDTVDGVEVIRCGCIAKVASQSISLTYPRELRSLMKDYAPDVVIFHYPNPYVAHFLLKHKSMPFKLYVFWHLDITKQKVLKLFFHNQNKRLIKRAAAIFGSTPVYLNESAYTGFFGDKKTLLPLAIDEDSLQITDQEMEKVRRIRIENEGKTICFAMGRHVPYKGFRYLLEASSLLDDSFVFYIAGTGELTEELKQQASADKKVVFLGRISDSDRRVYLQACDVFCFPSITRNEAFGLALAEAMYFGKPAVTFTIPGSGVNYVSLNAVTGLEVENRNSAKYAEALKTLADNPPLREAYGKAARERVITNFSRECFSRRVRELICSPEQDE